MLSLLRAASLIVVASPVSTTVSRPSQTVPDDFVISLERTSCFGECPVYSVTIDAKGNVTYDGKKLVRVEGRQNDRIPASSVTALLETVNRIQFFDLQDRYRALVSDNPTTFVTVTLNGRSKRIGQLYGRPPAPVTQES
jgi:hypothetical protein